MFKSLAGLAGFTQKSTDSALYAHTSVERDCAEGFYRGND
jgi:hypothetical protein